MKLRSSGSSEELPKKKGKGLSWRLLGKLLGRGSGSSSNLQPSPEGRGFVLGQDSQNLAEALSQQQGEGLGAGLSKPGSRRDLPVRSHVSMPHLASTSGTCGLPHVSSSNSPSSRAVAPAASNSTNFLQLPRVHAWIPSLSSCTVAENSCASPRALQAPPQRAFTSISDVQQHHRPPSGVSQPLTPPASAPVQGLEEVENTPPRATKADSAPLHKAALQPVRAHSSGNIAFARSSTAAFSPRTPLLSAPSPPVAPPPPGHLLRASPSDTIPAMPSASETPQAAPQPPATEATQAPASSQPSSHSSTHAANGEQSDSTLIAVGFGVPAAMRRPVWRLADYAISGRLYKGDMSSVYKAVCRPSGMNVVLKVYDLHRVPDNALHTLVREIRIHSDLAHDAILKLYGVFEESERLVLVLERAARGDLFSLHRGLPGCRMGEETLRQVVLVPLLEALAHLHARGVCHRDIKPENLLLTSDWRLRLADFGAAIDLAQERAVTRTGTVDYMAPEVVRCPLKCLPEENKDVPGLAYTTAADVWSVGVLAFEMLVGFPPFIRLDCGTRVAAGAGAAVGTVGAGVVSFPPFVSAGGQDFISLALAERPEDRPTAMQLLRHPWLKHALRTARAARAPTAAAAGEPPQQQQPASQQRPAAAGVLVPQPQLRGEQDATHAGPRPLREPSGLGRPSRANLAAPQAAAAQ